MQSVVCCYDYSPDFIKPHPDIILTYFNSIMLAAMTPEELNHERDIALLGLALQCPWTQEDYPVIRWFG